MRVNVFHEDFSQQASNIDLLECFPDGKDDPEYLEALTRLQRDGRYWGGGGASPLFYLQRVS